MRDFARIPAAVLDQHTVNELAEAIVARLGATMQLPRNGKPDWYHSPLIEVRFDANRAGMVQLNFPAEHAADIARHGIHNLHQQTGLQYQGLRSDWRAGVENNLARLTLGAGGTQCAARWNALRPKSAILEIDWPDNVAYRTTGGARFGDCVAVLKRSVYLRVTVTPHDSAALGPDKAKAAKGPTSVSARPAAGNRMTPTRWPRAADRVPEVTALAGRCRLRGWPRDQNTTKEKAAAKAFSSSVRTAP